MPEPSGTVKNLSELINRSAEAQKAFKRETVWWRGHSRAHWNLVPGVHRKGLQSTYEKNIVGRFMLKAHTRHHQCPTENDYPGWLFLMQHYRLPTRLLDWTESAMVAVFFAADGHPSKDGALWALDPFTLNRNQFQKDRILTPRASAASPLFHAPFQEKVTEQPVTAAVVGREVDIRMLIQQSVFTIHGAVTPIEAISGADNFTRKFIVPAASKQLIRRQLRVLGFKLHTLFPDLEHLASDLATLQFPPD